jgi:hypothetical protein
VYYKIIVNNVNNDDVDNDLDDLHENGDEDEDVFDVDSW